ncbi:MAG: segregation and condensation protein A [Halothiobacillaceae bacterium]
MNPAADGALCEAAVLARVRGRPMTQLPLDLYIPPDALSVFLETFEGPLDLLLYLIRRQNLDILDIPVAEVTRQYMEYLALMRQMKLELAAEYLLMAAWLAEIKSRMLLPRPPAEGEDEQVQDPRAQLVARLLEYERLAAAAESLDARPRQGRDHWPVQVPVPDDLSAWQQAEPPPVALAELVEAMQATMRRQSLSAHHQIRREPLSVRERMSTILRRLGAAGRLSLDALFVPAEGRAGMVVTFLAILELGKEGAIRLAQAKPFAAIELTVPEPADG